MKRWSSLVCASLVASATLVATSMVEGTPPGPPPPPPPSKGGPPPPPPGPPPPPQGQGPGLGGPFAGLARNESARWNDGKRAFLQPFNPPGGLGPVFTENACAKCHDGPTTGGSGQRLVTHFGRVNGGQFDPMTEFGGPQVQDHGIGRINGVNFVGEVVPPQATIVAKRRTIPLFGLGLVDAVPDNVFMTISHQQSNSTPQTAGVPSVVVDPVTGHNRVGKFGWKAQQPSLFAFAADALVNEIGITTPVFLNENCPQGNCSILAANPARSHPNQVDTIGVQMLTDFMTFTAPPPRGPVGANEQAGSTIFSQIGCINCHIPSLQTGPSFSPALNGVTFFAFSDFLLHDMGSLGDGIVQNQAGPHAMRTAPLWGLRFQPTLLHDGRATTPDQAIRAHDGQARASHDHYLQLNATQKSQLLAFLHSL